jgi:hypothetical protein
MFNTFWLNLYKLKFNTMKKFLFTLILIFTISLGYSQESKAYLGVSLGMAIPGGDAGEDVKTGLDIGFLNFGYRFSEKWGATLNLVSSGHVLDDYDFAAIGVAYWGIGPMYTASVSEKISWDFKPQLALGLVGKYAIDSGDSTLDGIIEDDWTLKGSGFVIGNSFVFGTNSGLKFSLNLDYLIGKLNEFDMGGVSVDIDDENGLNKLSLGAGLRYNF